MEKKRRKIGKGKVENLKWKEEKFENELRTLFFPLFFLLFKTTKICFGSTRLEIFYRGKKYSPPGKKSGKMTLPP